MLEFVNITKEYKKGVKAVDNLSMKVEKGSIFGFLGPNGAGKSTTIKMLVGLLSPSSGKILYDGKNIEDEPVAFRKLIAYVPDEPSFYQNISGYEYLNFIADIYAVSETDRKERIERYAKLFDLDSALRDKVKSYSHGMGQKLSLIAALIHEPEVIILDEPMVGLDPKASRDVKDIMKAIAARGATVFFSTHVLEVAQGICDEIGIIDKGHLIAKGKVDELLERAEDKTLEEFFLSVTEEKGND